MGGTGPGSHSIDMPLMLNKMLGTKFTVVSGYQGTAQIKIAMQRREVDGHCTNWDSVMATQKDLLDAKGDDRMIPFLLHASVNDPEGKNVTARQRSDQRRSESLRRLSRLHGADGILAPLHRRARHAQRAVGNASPRL